MYNIPLILNNNDIPFLDNSTLPIDDSTPTNSFLSKTRTASLELFFFDIISTSSIFKETAI